MCTALVTSRIRGVTRPSGWARGWRVPAYTRLAPRRRASLTSACPMPRLAPVTRTVLSAIVTMMTISFFFLIGGAGSSGVVVQAGHAGVARLGQVVQIGALMSSGNPVCAGARGSVGGGYRGLAWQGGRDRAC